MTRLSVVGNVYIADRYNQRIRKLYYSPTSTPTLVPTIKPTAVPTLSPSRTPTLVPTIEPTAVPTLSPSRTLLTCSDGYSQSGSGGITNGLACTKCSANTFSLAGDNSCTQCPSNSRSDAGSGKCVCNYGYTQTGSGRTSSCSPCSKNHYTSTNQCPSGYKFSPDTNSCYLYVSDALNYFDAIAFCNSNSSGYLVTIDSSTENSYIYSMCGSYDCWIGYNDLASEGSFVWLHGDSTYTNYDSGEPNNAYSREDCVQMRGSQISSTWNDNYCSDEQRFVCEADPYNECIHCPAGEVSSAFSLGCTAAGEIITIVGTDNNSSNIDTGLAVTSSTDTPRGIAIDASGNIYFAEQNVHRIRKITV